MWPWMGHSSLWPDWEMRELGTIATVPPPSEILLVYKELSLMVAKVWQAAIPSRYVLERTSNQGDMTLPMTRARAASSLCDHICSGDRGHPQVTEPAEVLGKELLMALPACSPVFPKSPSSHIFLNNQTVTYNSKSNVLVGYRNPVLHIRSINLEVIWRGQSCRTSSRAISKLCTENSLHFQTSMRKVLSLSLI